MGWLGAAAPHRVAARRASAGAAFAYAMALSLGDLGVVTLFGSDALVTLPALLYEKLGAYRVGEADGVAALLSRTRPGCSFSSPIGSGRSMLVLDDLTIRLATGWAAMICRSRRRPRRRWSARPAAASRLCSTPSPASSGPKAAR